MKYHLYEMDRDGTKWLTVLDEDSKTRSVRLGRYASDRITIWEGAKQKDPLRSIAGFKGSIDMLAMSVSKDEIDKLVSMYRLLN